jgi:hypothetical protein
MTGSNSREYRRLEAARIIATIAQLEQRIAERFPEAGLQKVCAELRAAASESSARVAAIGKPNLLLRALVVLVLAGGIALLAWLVGFIDLTKTSADNVYTVLQGIEATMNIFVLMGLAILSLVTIEDRMKRRRALRALHELRSIIHVIDMHQLTKDPSTIHSGLAPTEHSPKRLLSSAELERYLDYSSEMLSLTAKVAALYAQSFPDAVVTDAVSDIERVAANLSQKIWQKIMILEASTAREKAATAMAAPALAAPPPAAKVEATAGVAAARIEDDVPDPRV